MAPLVLLHLISVHFIIGTTYFSSYNLFLGIIIFVCVFSFFKGERKIFFSKITNRLVNFSFKKKKREKEKVYTSLKLFWLSSMPTSLRLQPMQIKFTKKKLINFIIFLMTYMDSWLIPFLIFLIKINKLWKIHEISCVHGCQDWDLT